MVASRFEAFLHLAFNSVRFFLLLTFTFLLLTAIQSTLKNQLQVSFSVLYIAFHLH